MKKSLMFLLLVAVLSFSYAGNKVATDYYYAGDYSTAKSFFLSGNLDAMDSYYLGQIYLKINKKDSAQYYYNKGLQIDPSNAFNKVGLATVTNDSKALDAIAKDKLYKKDVKVLIAIAEAYQLNKNAMQTTLYVEKAKKANKKNPLVYVFEGNQLLAEKKTNEAASKYDQAVYFDPNCKVAFFKLAQDVYKNVRASVAKENLEKAIAIDGEFAPALFLLADINNKTGFYPEALDAFNKYLTVVKPSAADYEKYAAILYFNKKYDEALVAISKAPDTFVMTRLKMYSENALDKKEDALVSGAKLFKMKTDNDSIISQDYTTYAKLLNDNKQYTEAGNNLVNAYNLDVTKINLLKEAAKAFELAKDYSKALPVYSQIATKSNSTVDIFTLGRGYYMAGNDAAITDIALKTKYLTQADSTFTVLTQQLPDNYMGYFWRARANAALDPETTQGLAKPHYEKAVEIMLPTAGERKNELMEAYRYLGYYNYLKNDKEQAKSYFNKVLELNPTDAVSIQAIQGLEGPKRKAK